MKVLHGFTVVSVIAIISACAPVQQQFSDQTFALGGSQAGYGATNPIAGAVGQANELGLINILVGQLGISPQQALGGVGSIFSAAQQRMSPGDFSQLSTTVPDMDRYLSSVPQQVAGAGSQSLLGAAGGLMGGQLGNLANLAGSFQSLGMNPSMVSQFVPVVLQYVQDQSGAGAMSLLQHALY
ncbi:MULTISPECIES: DUF2780 domain-containing protein [Methylomonas]|uniref:DUF2780 domain-containing protein n=2 Tax=Methylomonas TaxID=416 RepID=A0A126T0T1_9GAMM|nr:MULTISPECIES: DUF2780 domain-containing protein [Methylomonas]AMK75692.1 hypothetical protein JT25_004205 [Methylomonas denitrificans]OAH98312.1 hypothetical protein A1342_15070 [Methylomonas methanica]TCV82482.1 uncharacterized protein VcgC/VcgE DUF2780 [Methylomonas methanica]